MEGVQPSRELSPLKSRLNLSLLIALTSSPVLQFGNSLESQQSGSFLGVQNEAGVHTRPPEDAICRRLVICLGREITQCEMTFPWRHLQGRSLLIV